MDSSDGRITDNSSHQRVGRLRDLPSFLGRSKKWWLLPLLLTFLLLATITFLTSPAASPFIYSLF